MVQIKDLKRIFDHNFHTIAKISTLVLVFSLVRSEVPKNIHSKHLLHCNWCCTIPQDGEAYLFFITSLSVHCRSFKIKLSVHANRGAEHTTHDNPIRFCTIHCKSVASKVLRKKSHVIRSNQMLKVQVYTYTVDHY